MSGGATGYCKLKKTCADHQAAGKIGDACSNSKIFTDGFGAALACPCDMSGGLFNNACVGATASQPGVCKCSAAACTCANSGLPDGCGGTLGCPCPAGKVCNKKNNKCCAKTSCAAPPAAYPAGACGTLTDGCMGSSFSCGCKSAAKPNNKCALKPGLKWGACKCVPDSCAKLGVGTWANDGCGKPITCKG